MKIGFFPFWAVEIYNFSLIFMEIVTKNVQNLKNGQKTDYLFSKYFYWIFRKNIAWNRVKRD
jgi:hypothetical protein